MRFTRVLLLVAIFVPMAAAAPIDTAITQSSSLLHNDVLAQLAWKNQRKYQQNRKNIRCTNPGVRKEWSQLTKAERTEYIQAVKCLASKSPLTPSEKAPGVRSRYDDFVATHINQTFTIHATGNFIGWHRYFTWAYEKALREECGYRGYQPYYNWGKWASNPLASPIFDGSDTSMSGNGVYGCGNQSTYGIPTNSEPLIKIPHGAGGGCIDSGPFKDFMVNLGPVFPDLTCTPLNPINNYSDPDQAALVGLGYNPRCLKRDISNWTSSRWTKDSDIASLILKSNDIYTFWAVMQGGVPAFENNFMGVHTAGHFTLGGDPGGDFSASPGDPWFFLHHAMIDRTWWTWQNLDPLVRTEAVAGTLTISDDPPSRNATLDDDMDLGYNAGAITLRESMSTMDGPFCYRYE